MNVRARIVIGGFLFLTSVAAPASADPGSERKWRAKCASCHGDDGKGATEQGKKMGISDMTDKAWQAKFTDDQIRTTITNGFKRDKDGKKQEMESFKDKLTPEQITGLVAYVRSLAK